MVSSISYLSFEILKEKLSHRTYDICHKHAPLYPKQAHQVLLKQYEQQKVWTTKLTIPQL